MKREVNSFLTINSATTANVQFPPLYRVYLCNDDFTPREFVVKMLQIVFNMERVRAISVMHDAHLTGKGSCGEFVRDIAETRVAEAEEYALLYEHPLRCRMEAA